MLIHLTNDISHLIKLSFNTTKSTRSLDALSPLLPAQDKVAQVKIILIPSSLDKDENGTKKN
jgi:hypothetical protein